jgi:hypothetical protein
MEFTIGNRVFLKVILSLGLFSPPIPSLTEVSKVRKFIISSGYEMLKIEHLMHKVRGNYSSCTRRSSENMLTKKERWDQNRHKNWCISEFDTPLKANVLFCRFLENLIRFWTKLRLLLPCCVTLQKTLMYMFTIYHGPFYYSESIHMHLCAKYVINEHITHIGLQWKWSMAIVAYRCDPAPEILDAVH